MVITDRVQFWTSWVPAAIVCVAAVILPFTQMGAMILVGASLPFMYVGVVIMQRRMREVDEAFDLELKWREHGMRGR